MFCYLDMTFCDYENCKKFKKCERALTDKVKRDAKAWMGENAPICQFMERPECFK